jgi:hypothetical protein
VTGQSGIRQDDEVGTIHKRSVADKVDFPDFIVGPHDGEQARSVAVRRWNCMIWMPAWMIFMTVNKSGTKTSPRSGSFKALA